MKSPLVQTLHCRSIAYWIDGWSFKAIGQLYGYHPKTVAKYIKMLPIPRL